MRSVVIGDLVLYTSKFAVDENGVPAIQPAIVTKVTGDKVSLAIFYPSGYFSRQEVPFNSTSTPGHWHWKD